jgi:hypothetical protein
MRLCKLCKKQKSEVEFYNRVGCRCKECHKEAVRARAVHLAETDPQWAVKEMDRQRLKERRRREQGIAFKSSPEQRKIILQKSQSKDPRKKAATTMVNNAIRDGRLLKKPCEVCNHPVVQAHHDDYTKPLEVRWLCVPHHNEHHVQERRKALLAKLQSGGVS